MKNYYFKANSSMTGIFAGLSIVLSFSLSCAHNQSQDTSTQVQQLENELPKALYDSLQNRNTEAAVIFIFSSMSCMECLTVAEESLQDLKNSSVIKIAYTDFADQRYLMAKFFNWKNMEIWETNSAFSEGEVAVLLYSPHKAKKIVIDLSRKDAISQLLKPEAVSFFTSGAN